MTENILAILDELYSNIDGQSLSHQAREELTDNGSSYVYGEIVFSEFCKMLAVVEPRAGEKFYDLGAGTGKAVFAAALFYDWDSCFGIEFLPKLHQCSADLLLKFAEFSVVQQDLLHKLNIIQFVNHDLRTLDFSDADVIFTHATCFEPDLWKNLTAKFDKLKSGTRIIVITKNLDEDHFKKLKEAEYNMTWGNASVRFYQKK